MKLPYLLVALCFCTSVSASAIPLDDRGLDEVFPGFDSPLPAETHAEQQHSPEREQPTHIVHIPTTTTPVTSAATSVTSAGSKGSSTQTHQQSTASSAGLAQVTNSIIGTIPPLPSYTPWSANRPDTSTASQATSTPTQTSSTSQSSTKGGTSSTQEWKIVGVAVIAFTSVAAILLLSVFFDHWWGFLRDIFWRKKRKDNLEELIPDWKTASWEIRFGGDGNRYPTIPPPAATKQLELDLDRARSLPSAGNVAGVGSGFKGDAYSHASPRQEYQISSPWTPSQGLGLSPLPAVAQFNYQQPPGLAAHTLRREESNHLGVKGSPPSPALTDPYGGIAE